MCVPKIFSYAVEAKGKKEKKNVTFGKTMLQALQLLQLMKTMPHN